MYTIDIFHFSWGAQPTVVRLILLGQLALVLISFVRFAKSAGRLYRFSRKPILPDSVIEGEIDPNLLAASALAGRALSKTVQGSRANPESAEGRASAAKALGILRAAECRFRYLWERCHADVESARRASLLTFLLSLVMVAFAPAPIYFGCWNNSKLTGSTCMFATVWHLLVLLGLGWSCSAALYFASSLFARALACRKAGWEYFCARMINELSR
jgi:hypothetical protein